MKLCKGCGGPLKRGWTCSGNRRRYCAICAVERSLASWVAPTDTHENRYGECACGCGREGEIRGYGLVGTCYQRLWRKERLGDWREKGRAA